MDYIPRSRCIASTYWHGLMSYRPSSAFIEESNIFFCIFFIKLEWQSSCLLSFLPSDPYSRLLVCRYLVEKRKANNGRERSSSRCKAEKHIELDRSLFSMILSAYKQ